MSDGESSSTTNESTRGQRLRDMIAAARSAASDARSRSGVSRGGGVSTGPPSDAIPGYELQGELHRGGQGVVYLGVHNSTGRRVAIKVMREGAFAGPADRARFEREIRILGALQDPRIVAIHHSGSAAGSHFFVMDLIDGLPLEAYLRGRTETIPAIAAIFAQICKAVNSAHLLGIVHRDLKPANILIDDHGTPHILDFGLAKSVGGSLHPQAGGSMTETGQFLGSLPWSAPEQTRGSGADITTRTDVHAIGILLYQALTSRFPYPITGDLDQVLRHIQSTEPVRPRTIRRDIDDEIETIVLKCLAKDPDRRYATAGELERDLECYLNGDPISAKRESTWYVLRKSIHRHRTALTVSLSIVLLIAASTIALSVMYRQQSALLIDISLERDKARLAKRAADEGRQQAEYEGYMAIIAAAAAAVNSNDGGTAMRRLDQAPTTLRNWEWRYLSKAADSSTATIRGPDNRPINQLRFSADGRHLAGVAYQPNRPPIALVWEWAAGKTILNEPLDSNVDVPHFATPICFSNTDEVVLRRSRGHIERRYLTGNHPPQSMTTSADDPNSLQWLIAPGSYVGTYNDKTLAWIHYRTDPDDAVRGAFPLDPTTWACAASASDDGSIFAVAQSDNSIQLCEFKSGAHPIRFVAHDAQIYGLAFSPNGDILASTAEDGIIKLWQLPNRNADAATDANTTSTIEPTTVREIRSFRGSTQRVYSVAFSPDGERLAAASADKTLRIWSVENGSCVSTLRGHEGPISGVAFHPDGIHVATGSYDATIRIWDLSLPTETVCRTDMPGIINVVSFDSRGERLIVGSSGGPVVIDPESGRTLNDLTDMPLAGFALFDNDEANVILSCRDGTIRTRTLDTGVEQNRVTVGKDGITPALALNPSRTLLACSIANEQFVSLIDPQTGITIRQLEHADNISLAAAFSPDDRFIATATMSGALYLWETESGRCVWSTQGNGSIIISAAFSPDVGRIATASEDTTIKLIDVNDGRVAMTLQPRLGDVWCVAFSPDGTRLAAGGRDRSVRLFDTYTGVEVLTLRGLTGTAISIAFSPDGRRLAAGSWAREVFIWDAGSNR